MIFNKEFNRTLTLINTTNKEFKETYKAIVGIVPTEIAIYTRKSEDTRMDNNECKYEFFTYKNNNEEYLKLIINDYKDKYGILITVSTISEQTLKSTLSLNDTLEIASIAIQNKGSSLEYAVEIKRTSEDKYELIIKKIIDQNYDNINIETENLTYNELARKLNLNLNKR